MGVGESQWVSMETGVAHASCAPHKGPHHPDKGLIAAFLSVSCIWVLPGRPFYSNLNISVLLQHLYRAGASKVRQGSCEGLVYLFHHTHIFIPTVNEWFIASRCAFSTSSILPWIWQFCAESCVQPAHTFAPKLTHRWWASLHIRWRLICVKEITICEKVSTGSHMKSLCWQEDRTHDGNHYINDLWNKETTINK